MIAEKSNSTPSSSPQIDSTLSPSPGLPRSEPEGLYYWGVGRVPKAGEVEPSPPHPIRPLADHLLPQGEKEIMKNLSQGGEKRGGGLNKSQLVSLAFELGFIIAIPVVVFGYLGKWLDQKTGTYPLLTLIGILTAIVSTSVWMYRKFKNYFNK